MSARWTRRLSRSADSHSRSRRVLAVLAYAQIVQLWDVADPSNPAPIGQPISTLGGYSFAVPFSPDGSFLAFADGANAARLLDLNVDHAKQRICASTRGLMTPTLWQAHLSELPYTPPC